MNEKYISKEYKYISFVESGQKPKTKVYQCINNTHQTVLGLVRWHPAWRQYCYFTLIEAVYSSGCLNDITDFLNTLNKK